jgi:hypothetical protein
MTVLTFLPNGSGHGLYTDAIELTAIGPLTIERATVIEFNHTAQRWEVHGNRGDFLYANVSRANCLAWEHQQFNQ